MSDIPKTREYARAAAHPIRHIGEASHPERGTLDCVLRSTADAMRDELIARIIELEGENAELRKQNDILATARRLEEAERRQAEATIERLTAWRQLAREQMRDAALRAVDARWTERSAL